MNVVTHLRNAWPCSGSALEEPLFLNPKAQHHSNFELVLHRRTALMGGLTGSTKRGQICWLSGVSPKPDVLAAESRSSRFQEHISEPMLFAHAGEKLP